MFAIPYSVFRGFSIFQQIASKTLSKFEKHPQTGRRWPPNAPKRVPRALQETPRALQEAPKSALRGPKSATKTLK